VNGYEYDEGFDEVYDEAWDESDLESAFEGLEYDEARRRRRRRRPRRRGRVPVPAGAPSGVANANLQRDRQLAKAVNVVNEDVGDVAARQAKANADLRTLKSAIMFSALVPPRPTATVTRLTINEGQLTASAPTANAPAAGEVDVATSVNTTVNLTQALLPMMLMNKVGAPPGKATGNDGMMMMFPLLLLTQQQQQQGQTLGQPATQAGGLDPTMLLLVMMMGGMLS
jgi:hypothetical protein